MGDMGRRLMTLDTASLYFRAYYGVPNTVGAPDGTPVNAVRGLLDFISRLVTNHRPTDLVAAWDDDWRPDFRVAAIASYKAHRVGAEAKEDVPDDLSPQVDIIIDLLAALGIARIGAPGYEADDVIGSLAEQAAHPVEIVTGDRDLFQLINDSQGIRVLYTASKGVGNAEVIDESAVLARYGVRADQYADFALLRGDPSDGLPGVLGIGEKTAARLLTQFGSIAELVSALESDIEIPATRLAAKSVSAKLRRKILSSRDYIEAAGPVVRVARDIVLPDVDMAVPIVPADPAAVAYLGQRWGLGRSVDRVLAAMAASGH